MSVPLVRDTPYTAHDSDSEETFTSEEGIIPRVAGTEFNSSLRNSGNTGRDIAKETGPRVSTSTADPWSVSC